MIISKIGKYKLLKPLTTRGSFSIGTFPKDSIIEITQIDKDAHKVIGLGFEDWRDWDIDAKPLK